MKPELEEKLFNKYPKLFTQKDLPMTHTCMCWGIETNGDGWYWLIDSTLDTIQKYIDLNMDYQPEIIQIKEKYAALDISMNGNTMIDGMLWLSHSLSMKICEDCGRPGNQYEVNGWLYTKCDTCRGSLMFWKTKREKTMERELKHIYFMLSKPVIREWEKETEKRVIDRIVGGVR